MTYDKGGEYEADSDEVSGDLPQYLLAYRQTALHIPHEKKMHKTHCRATFSYRKQNGGRIPRQKQPFRYKVRWKLPSM